MGMKIDAQDFKVKMTPEAIGGKDGKRSFVGSAEQEKNLIVIDGTLEPSRQEEVLLHELIHISDSGIPEFMVKNISGRLYGFLKTNDLLRPGLIDRVSDGTLSKADMAKVSEESNELAEKMEEMGEIIPFNDAVSEGPWYGESGAYTEPDGRINRVGVHYAARDMVSGRLAHGARRSESRRLVQLYRDVLKEEPPIALVRLAQ